jgi:hypothetical protein
LLLPKYFLEIRQDIVARRVEAGTVVESTVMMALIDRLIILLD